jgi:membrane protease YdiL (CAAX protease family)
MSHFSRTERTILLVALVLAAGAGVFAWTNFTRAFPEASLTFTVNRSTSRPVAETFLRAYAPAAAKALARHRHAALFRVDDDAKVYLERELGLARMGELVKSHQVRLWSWAHRWFRPLDKEEVGVEVAPEGDVVGFAHLIPEAAPGASLDEAAARVRAERFLHDAMGIAPVNVTFIESHREDRPARRDWTFTFERAGWKASQATWRMQVEVHGDEIAAYRQFLKVPDAWTQGYEKLRSANDTTALVAAFGIVLTLLAAVIVIFREGRRGNVRWRLVLLLSSIAFVLVFALHLNELPISAFSFDTTGSFGAFLARQVLSGFASAGGSALFIFVVVAAGEPLFRARFGGHLRITALFERAGWRSRRFTFGLILGYCLAVLFLAYQVAFYLVGKRFGAWNPADVPFDNLLNTSVPWIAVLFMGFFPAVSEEFMSRVFSIPLVERLTRSRIAAVVVPALIWGFAHANYPAQPYYIRGVEVATAGIVLGVILYRFGALPCLVWHYVVDAGYTSMLMVRSGNLYLATTAIAGTGALLIPLAITLVGAWRRGGFVDDPALDNAADPPPPQAPARAVPQPVAIEAAPLRRIAPVALVLAVIGGVLVWRAPDPGRGIGVTLRPAAVRRAAMAFLLEHGADPARWRLVVTAQGEVLSPLVRRFLLEHGGIDAVHRLAAQVPAWEVRALRPEEREGWQLGVDDPGGHVVRFDHVLREETPGASLSEAAARTRAEAALADAGFDIGKLVFKEAKSDKRPARLDYTLTWKDPARSVGDGEYLLDVTVHGDRVDGMERRFKLPEAWERAREATTARHYVLLAIKIAIVALLIVHGILGLFRGVRTGVVPWRAVAWSAGAVTMVVAVGAALRAPLLWADYQAAVPEALFRTGTWVSTAIAVLARAGLAVLALGALTAFYPSARALGRANTRRRLAAASCLAALAALGAVLAFDGLQAFALSAWPTAFSDAPVSVPAAAATVVPPLATIGGRLLYALLALAGVGVAVHFWKTLRGGWLKAGCVAAALLALLPAGADATAPELAAGVIHAIVVLGGGALLLRLVLGENPFAYVLAAVWIATAATAAPLIGQPGAFYAGGGWALLALVAAASAAWLLSRPRTARPHPSP